ncbi:LysR family transcriptional regulator [Archangium primigenium]|nr:LysR family transcriptional regulator [Archangium primigenium]
MGMDLNAALVFVHVVNSGSFTGAARVLGIPASTVSDRVAALEASLGSSLLTRTTRTLKLTDVGREFFTKAEAAVNALLHAGEEASQAQQRPTGVLRMTGPSDFATREIAESIAEYHARFPGVRVETHLSNRAVDVIAEGFDIAIRGGDLDDSSLIAKPIGAGCQILAASPAYLRRAPAIDAPEELSRHPCIGFLMSTRKGAEPPWVLRTAAGKTTRVKPGITNASTSFAMIIDLMKAGEGIALLPETLIQDELEEGGLIRVLPGWSTARAPVHLVYPRHRFASPKIQEMLPILERRLRARLTTRPARR